MTLSPQDKKTTTQLSAAKRALLEQRLRNAKAKNATLETETVTIPPRATDDPAPLSFSQQRLWFLDQLEPANATYNMPDALRLSGDLNVAAFEQALHTILQRHEILRTTFAEVDEQPVQIVAPEPTTTLQLYDVSGFSGDTHESIVARLASEEAVCPFDLLRGPLLRVCLVRIERHEHVLLVTMHHIISDGWSCGVFFKELSTLYNAMAANKPTSLSALPIQYGDYAVWQQRELQGERLHQHMAYWKEQLANAETILKLPTDRPRPSVQTFRGAHHAFTLSPERAKQLQDIARREGCTLFMALLSLYTVLLARYSGQRDILVGSPMAGRDHAELEGLIGFFLNTLVLRTRFADNPTFQEVLRHTREMTLGAFAHQELPFERLVDELKPERNLGYTPLFQVMFTLQNAPAAPLQLTGITSRSIGFDFNIAKVDLSLSMEETADGITGLFTYNTDLFDATTIERMAAHFHTLTDQFIANPAQSVYTTPLLTPDEQRLLQGWNDTVTSERPGRCLHHLIEEQAERTPESIALVQSGQQLSYTALNQRANQLARVLQQRGVGPEVRVGICVERSFDMVVSVLAVLKAGGVYLPLDLDYPSARLAYILENAQPHLILTQQTLEARLPAFEGEKVCLDRDQELWSNEDGSNLPTTAAAENLAYIVHTSGSTGQPKGVLSTHRGATNYLAFLADRYALSASDVALQIATLSFDASVRDLLGPLSVGAKVVLVEQQQAKDPAALLDTMRRQDVTCLLSVVPTLLRGMAEAAESPMHASSISLMLLSGESLRSDDCHAAQTLFGTQVQLVNQYGPTECTMTSSYYRVDERALAQSAIPVGRPIDNAQIHILDEQLNPAPIGVYGEVYITSLGLARGYLNRPATTAVQFLPNSFSSCPGTQLYRTGDVARYRADGTIELGGRIDHQIKIRGVRVELGEIEAVLNQHPAVQRAAVTYHQQGGNEGRLVAYLVAEAEAPSISTLRAFLKDFLPDAMIPAAFVVLDAVPLTTNGKINRRALPAPEHASLDLGTAYVAPQTETEERLAQIWMEVLGIERVGIDDNFFDLGGDSFKSIRVVRKFGDSMRVFDIFKHPTIRALAVALSQERTDEHALLQELTPALSPQERTVSYVCFPYGGGSAISYQPLARALPRSHSLYAVALPGHDFTREDEEPAPFHEVARACADEIQQTISGRLVIYGHCAGSAMAIEVARLLEADGVQVERVYLGGTFPNVRLPGKLFEFLANNLQIDRLSGDRTYETFFTSLGGFADVIDDREVKQIIKNLRQDSRDAEDYFTYSFADKQYTPLIAPIVCIVGDKDPLTEYYQERYQEWEFFSSRVHLQVLPQAGHYFIKHRAAEVADMLTAPPPSVEETVSVSEEVQHETTRIAGRRTKTPAPVSQAGLLPTLRIFLIVAAGQFVSLVGSGLTGFALGVWVYLQTGSVTQFALISVFAMLPGIIFSPLAGAVIDRSDRRKVMIFSDLGAGLGTLALTLLLWTGQLEIWLIYLILTWNSICNTFQRPAYASAIPQLVPKRYLWQANGIVQMTEAGSRGICRTLEGITDRIPRQNKINEPNL
ncbi:MAG: amino acid adenylation domain-containing protein, partial [Chloroflexota bacterium]